MTDKKLTDKEVFATEIKCINRRASGQCNGGTDCCTCDLLMNEKDIISAYERAIANIDLINHLEEKLKQQSETIVIRKGCIDWQAKEINRLQAEKERLESLSERLGDDVDLKLKYIYELEEKLKTAKAEAYKECIEKVRQLLFAISIDGKYFTGIHKHSFDNLLKELVGENDV